MTEEERKNISSSRIGYPVARFLASAPRADLWGILLAVHLPLSLNDGSGSVARILFGDPAARTATEMFSLLIALGLYYLERWFGSFMEKGKDRQRNADQVFVLVSVGTILLLAYYAVRLVAQKEAGTAQPLVLSADIVQMFRRFGVFGWLLFYAMVIAALRGCLHAGKHDAIRVLAFIAALCAVLFDSFVTTDRPVLMLAFLLLGLGQKGNVWTKS